ncbi:MAG: sialate O-acetylesterase [Tannerella sp.]|nr:sialate O-acetylesterase [Tannerella sp.]
MGKAAFILMLCFGCTFLCRAEVKLPALISNGIVLQRDQPIVVWGTADKEEPVEVSFMRKKYKTTADIDGNWKVTLPPVKAGGPYIMTINDIEINDILIGDVWLCSGQSNMELPIRRVLDLYADEVKDYANPMIRYIKTPTAYSYHEPQSDVPSVTWMPLTPDYVFSYSALCYFFARDLYEKIKVPIGIINSSVGGSPIESWISEEGLKAFPHYIHDRDLHRSDAYIRNAAKLDWERRSLWNQIVYKEDRGLHEKPAWYESAFDDTNWEKTDLNNKDWSIDGLSFVNGTFWFRKDFVLDGSLTGTDAILRLGCITDADSVFINGVFVGTTSYQYPPRIYTVPKDLLKQGRNNITIRLFSYSGRAEFVDDKPYKLIVRDHEIDLSEEWKYKPGVRMPAYQGVPTTQQKPTGFYNGMIAPLENLAFTGVIWYQGESNAERYHEYSDLLSSLIDDWRGLFKKPELPFFIVQLPNFMKQSLSPSDGHWANMRESQRKVVATVPNTGLIVTIDLGEWNDIHPLNKKDIGLRLSLQAQKMVYGRNVTADGPVYQSMEIQDNRIVLSFKDGTDDLIWSDQLKGFAIAGKDRVFKWANAKTEGSKVIVWNDEIAEPLRVRYAWADNPGELNFRNKAGLPASPFEGE